MGPEHRRPPMGRNGEAQTPTGHLRRACMPFTEQRQLPQKGEGGGRYIGTTALPAFLLRLEAQGHCLRRHGEPGYGN